MATECKIIKFQISAVALTTIFTLNMHQERAKSRLTHNNGVISVL